MHSPTTSSDSPQVLITGANGFIGHAITSAALQAGYRVRAAVRRQETVASLTSKAASIQPYLENGSLEYVVVADNAVPAAYRDAAKGCEYIIHTASPLPMQPGNLVAQALAGTKAVIDAAEATETVRRVVFTASSASLRPFEEALADHPRNVALIAGKGEEWETITGNTVNPDADPVPGDEEPGGRRYFASKAAANNYVREYVKKHPDSRFSVVSIMPGYVLGPEELSKTKVEGLGGSNVLLAWIFIDLKLNALFGVADDVDCPVLSDFVSLKDVVEAHLKALDTAKVPGPLKEYLLGVDSPRGIVMTDAVNIVKKHFPKEVQNGVIPFAGEPISKYQFIDESNSFLISVGLSPDTMTNCHRYSDNAK